MYDRCIRQITCCACLLPSLSASRPMPVYLALSFFFFNDTATTEIYTLSLHDALPISADRPALGLQLDTWHLWNTETLLEDRSEEHTSELQSLRHLVCRLLLEKKKKKKQTVRQRQTRNAFTALSNTLLISK